MWSFIMKASTCMKKSPCSDFGPRNRALTLILSRKNPFCARLLKSAASSKRRLKGATRLKEEWPLAPAKPLQSIPGCIDTPLFHSAFNAHPLGRFGRMRAL
jgi:hypothetical protein